MNKPDSKTSSLDPDENRRRELREKKFESLITMATGVAHDFNNYLTAILGNNEIILDNLPKDSRLLLNARQIRKTAVMGLDLTNEIIFYTARARKNLNLIDPASVINQMRKELDSSAGTRISVAYRIGPVSPIRADVDQIRMVIRNLIANACDALLDSPEGKIVVTAGMQTCTQDEIEATMLVAGVAAGHYAFIEVSDNGKGMSPAVQERMYDPFFSTKLRGRGMGLAVVVGILRAHGGTITAQTVESMGTTVRVLLPCAEPE